MKFFLDDQAVSDREHDDGTLEQSLRAVQSTLENAKRILVGFRCDGEDMIGLAMTEALKQPAASFDRIDAYSTTRTELVVETMTHASASLEEAEGSIHEIARMLTEGRAKEAIPQLGECLTVWQQVHEAVWKSLTLLELDPAKVKIGDETVDATLARPKDVLTQIKNALLAQDHVLLADILQYEFTDVTEMWHSLIDRLNQEAAAREASTSGKG
jgi:hypothetical protein